MIRLPRPLYIVFRGLHDLVAVGSRLINATRYGGSTQDTLSSRAHFDSHFDPEWEERRLRINRLFFWQEDHCEADYLYGLEQAQKKLDRHVALVRAAKASEPSRPP